MAPTLVPFTPKPPAPPRLTDLTREQRIARINRFLNRLDDEQLQVAEAIVACIVRGAL